MPKNNKLPKIELPIDLCFGEKPETNFVNNLDSITVKLVNAPTMEELMEFLPNFVRATWNEKWNSSDTMSQIERLKIVRDVFFGRTLPTAMETIGLTFLIDGIDITTATHLIRYRQGSFSADCSADKWWHKRDSLVPKSIENSPEFYKRFKEITLASKKLYCDMIDSKEIPIPDARAILGRSLSTYYFMRLPLNATLHFIKQRTDRQIQPEVDNLIAYKMYEELLKQYPIANGLVDIDAQDKLYISLGEEYGKMYLPEEKNDVFEYNEENFLYPKLREEMNGTSGGANYLKSLFYKAKENIRNIESSNNWVLLERHGVEIEDIEKVVPRRR